MIWTNHVITNENSIPQWRRWYRRCQSWRMRRTWATLVLLCSMVQWFSWPNHHQEEGLIRNLKFCFQVELFNFLLFSSYRAVLPMIPVAMVNLNVWAPRVIAVCITVVVKVTYVMPIFIMNRHLWKRRLVNSKVNRASYFFLFNLNLNLNYTTS